MHPEGNRKVVMAWAAHYEANMAEALEARQELCEGRPIGAVKQLVLSVALTPVEFRCGHYGDVRICPQCQWEEENGEVKQPRHRVGEQRATIERQSAALESQSHAMDRQSAEVRRLRLREQQLLRVCRHGNDV